MSTVKQKDVYKLFKQAMLSRRYLSHELAGLLWKKCEDACKSLNEEIPTQYTPEEKAVDEYIHEISDTLRNFSLEFKSRKDEVSGKRMWAVVNTLEGEIAQVATEYTAAELAYFKQVIDLIVLAPADAYSVSSLAAVREVSNMKASMTKAQAETALQSFVANGWLYKSERARYGLSTRTLIELELYLRRTYATDLPECTACQELCTLGVACENDCPAVYHRHCYEAARRRANPTCAACEADWTRGDPVKEFGEDSLPYGFDDFKRRRRLSEYDDDDVIEEEVESPQLVASPPPPKRGKLVRKGQKSQPEPDSADSDE